ncbi:hypothetical protein E1091_03035 [Micromonospora fluostatini]|uniref:Uncharacterized protein n=1 Tax=Micromonospora fluostatini TaxID=1629071 RepID=A0ABY2DKP8_9ACTN|nr:hypothetical protein E1091_03035 [Micromonospora fluostatini]
MPRCGPQAGPEDHHDHRSAGQRTPLRAVRQAEQVRDRRVEVGVVARAVEQSPDRAIAADQDLDHRRIVGIGYACHLTRPFTRTRAAPAATPVRY